MSDKIRLDSRIFDLGLTDSREKAKAFIMAGQVYVNGMKATKAGLNVTEKDLIEVRGTSEFVSRGGHKLKKAMQSFPILLTDKICMDIGASTGGFTDCMLQNGAKKVFSIDVGYGQLAWKLRQDERVVSMERTNIRYVTDEIIPDKIDFFSVDVSFISLTLVLPAVKNLLSAAGEGVCLIKPQFEAGREKVGKKGVVRDKSVHEEVIVKIINFAEETGFSVHGLDYSPIKGPEGNIEYLLHIGLNKNNNDDISVKAVVDASHNELDK